MSKSILIIEGDGESVETAKLILENVGYVVRATGDAQLALSWWREQPWDLVLLNPFIHISEGHLLYGVVQNDPNLRRSRLGYLIGKGDLVKAKQEMRIPSALTIIKPFEFEELLNRVEQLVGPAYED